MVAETILRCDLCGKQLEPNEAKQTQPTFGFGGKPKSRYGMELTYEGVTTKGDLCFTCAKKLRDFKDELKQGKK